MKENKIIEGLKDLIEDRENFILDETDEENIFVKDKETLEKAINLIQEQLENKIIRIEELECELRKEAEKHEFLMEIKRNKLKKLRDEKQNEVI